ncbi:DUF2393 family protein [Campylobacter sp. CCS1377]|uniref:DUF2393 family protein n=1 Tax=Campylobacter sp. CCS1377 TaxID=3158229 RepID=A0AAU7E867_9BACT|nr:DUF2393 domain-containing protein [Campylobacter jejuni]
MYFTGFHFIISIILLLCFILICILIFLKIKNKQIAAIFYGINVIFIGILSYSLFLTINQYTKKTSITNINYKRNLRSESIIISGRLNNFSKYPVKNCVLKFTIVDKRGDASGEMFNTQNFKNTKGENRSVSYDIELTSFLAGNTYQDFVKSVPMPPEFINFEFYHTLSCR